MTAASTERADDRQAANLLGALALALSDRLEGAVTGAADLAESDAVALSALHHFLESPRVDLLAQVLGLSSSGTVRVVDRLEALVRVGQREVIGETDQVGEARGRKRGHVVAHRRRGFVEGRRRHLRRHRRGDQGGPARLPDGILRGLLQPRRAARQPDQRRGRARRWNVAAGASAVATVSVVPSWITDFRPDLPKIDVPTLIVHGDADRVLPLEPTAARLPDLIADSELVVIEGAPHGLLWTHAAEVNEALLAFLDRDRASRELAGARGAAG